MSGELLTEVEVDFWASRSTMVVMIKRNNDIVMEQMINRNNDLLLQILLELTTPPFPKKISPDQFQGFGELSPEYFLQHIALLAKHEMIVYDPPVDRRGSVVAQIAWRGHDFLAYAKHDYVWEAAKEAGGHFSFGEFIEYLQEANRKAGMTVLTNLIKTGQKKSYML